MWCGESQSLAAYKNFITFEYVRVSCITFDSGISIRYQHFNRSARMINMKKLSSLSGNERTACLLIKYEITKKRNHSAFSFNYYTHLLLSKEWIFLYVARRIDSFALNSHSLRLDGQKERNRLDKSHLYCIPHTNATRWRHILFALLFACVANPAFWSSNAYFSIEMINLKCDVCRNSHAQLTQTYTHTHTKATNARTQVLLCKKRQLFILHDRIDETISTPKVKSIDSLCDLLVQTKLQLCPLPSAYSCIGSLSVFFFIKKYCENASTFEKAK